MHFLSKLVAAKTNLEIYEYKKFCWVIMIMQTGECCKVYLLLGYGPYSHSSNWKIISWFITGSNFLAKNSCLGSVPCNENQHFSWDNKHFQTFYHYLNEYNFLKLWNVWGNVDFLCLTNIFGNKEKFELRLRNLEHW